MSVMTAEQRAKRIERAQAEVDKLQNRVERLTRESTDAASALEWAKAELLWWQRPVGEQPEKHPTSIEEPPV